MIRGSLVGAAGESIDYDLQLPVGPGPFATIVVCHGFKGFRNWGYFPEIARGLARAGFAALRLDLSHNGIDRERGLDFVDLDLFEANRPSYEVADLHAVLDALATGELPGADKLRRSNFGLLGHSRGGAAVMLTARERNDVAAVVTWASVASLRWPEAAREALREFGHFPVQNARTGQTMRVGRAAIEEGMSDAPEFDLGLAAESLGDRLLVLHGDRDQAVPLAAAEQLAAWAGGQCAPLIVRGADHVMNCRHPFTGPTPAFETALAASIAHFNSRL
ncbi:MAG: alpha/beta fold hydrolase [Planctomycetes bacterium]|nr:alpha/beta fold hydrolase [Planctomycetota bacterium]